EAVRGSWQPADFHLYMEIAVDAFGPERLMIGSDWPVCLLAAEYPDALGIVTDFLGRLSEDEQALILGKTASRFYGLGR
ncbi:MAG: amidohydrolase family protein, partial [Pirellulales bacterium]|nr:amidohydrolase family protein [Pirellulales bacterium]